MHNQITQTRRFYYFYWISRRNHQKSWRKLNISLEWRKENLTDAIEASSGYGDRQWRRQQKQEEASGSSVEWDSAKDAILSIPGKHSNLPPCAAEHGARREREIRKHSWGRKENEKGKFSSFSDSTNQRTVCVFVQARRASFRY